MPMKKQKEAWTANDPGPASTREQYQLKPLQKVVKSHRGRAKVPDRKWDLRSTANLPKVLLFAVVTSLLMVGIQMHVLEQNLVSTQLSEPLLSPESIAGGRQRQQQQQRRRRRRSSGVGSTERGKQQRKRTENKLKKDYNNDKKARMELLKQQIKEGKEIEEDLRDDDDDDDKLGVETKDVVPENLDDDGKDPIKAPNNNNRHSNKAHDKSHSSEADVGEDLEPILKILEQGGYDTSKSSKKIDRSVLPKWSDIMETYGPPKILGLESCQAFRDAIPEGQRGITPAGMFNTGTNLLANMLYTNCDMHPALGKRGIFWQPLWGKHTPGTERATHKLSNKARLAFYPPYDYLLPVVTVRDPYTWMQSMCRQGYGAQFEHNDETCPNIVPYESDMVAHPRFRKMKYIPVNIKYDFQPEKVHHDSLAHLWNDWYHSYVEFEETVAGKGSEKTSRMKEPAFPFLVVRMEDLVFHGETVMPQLCECAGGTMKGPFKHFSMIANLNSGIDTSGGKDTGLLRSVVKYGNTTNRRKGYPGFQLEAAKEILDPRLMDLLAYPYEKP